MKSLGTTENIDPVVAESFKRAAAGLTPEQRELAMKCWKDSVCETGHGDVTVALADGFGENVWRQVTKMEFIVEALTYPEHQEDHLHLGPQRPDQGDLRPAQPDRAGRQRHRRLRRRQHRAAADDQGSHRGRHHRRPAQRHLCRRRARQGLPDDRQREPLRSRHRHDQGRRRERRQGRGRRSSSSAARRATASAPAGRNAPTRRSPSTRA